MEVHAHTHTARKKWTHYFWEFLMLFLAVFCGFLAEYGLEHKIETDREKQYVRTMIEDLKLDTSVLNGVIQARTRRIEMLDSLSLMLYEAGNKDHLSDLYFFSRYISRVSPITFTYNDRTIQQMKNSGGLRLIRNRVVSDSIILYDSGVRYIESAQEREANYVGDCLPHCYKIFDGRIYDRMLGDDNILHRPSGNPSLLQSTTENINAFNGSLHLVKSINRSNRVFSIQLYNKAVNLLNTIKTEYHLK